MKSPEEEQSLEQTREKERKPPVTSTAMQAFPTPAWQGTRAGA